MVTAQVSANITKTGTGAGSPSTKTKKSAAAENSAKETRQVFHRSVKMLRKSVNSA